MGKTRALRKYRRKSKQVKSHVKPFSKKSRKRSTKHKKNKRTVKGRQGVKNRKSRRIARGGVGNMIKDRNAFKYWATDNIRAAFPKVGSMLFPTSAQKIEEEKEAAEKRRISLLTPRRAHN